MSTRRQRQLSASSLGLLAVAFIAAVIVSNQLFKGARIDLTENRLYTLSEGTERILDNVGEPINLYFFWSDKAAEGIPSLRDYARRVREMLEEFEDAAGGKIRLSIIDPVPFSEEEDRAAQFGLQGVQLAGGPDPIYLGLAGTDSVDNEEIIPFFQPDKEAFLEYDVAKLVSTLADPERTVIGLVSGIDMAGRFDPQTQQMREPWVVYQQVQQLFEIENLGTEFDDIPDEVSLLWIVQPRDLSNTTLYAIDQFIMRGGKALIFVDPVSDADPAQPMQGMPPGMPPMGQGSDLPALFDAWGLEFSGEVVADAQLALQISSPVSRRPVRHFGYIGATSEQLDPDDVVTAELSTINFATSGHLAVSEDSPAALVPLVTSSTFAATMPASRFSFLPDPSALQDGFRPSGEAHVLAARLSGKLPSAFPDGPPPASVSSADGDADETGDGGTRGDTDDDGTEGDAGDAAAPEPQLGEAAETANLIIVADVDMLTDTMWVQLQSFFGQRIANAFASNGAFVVNALDSLAGSADLIGVRSRGSYSRPFTRVEELRVDAEARFRETEQRLQDELAETERRLGELQSSREDTGNILLTAEQQQEIDRFIDRRVEIRRELRAVQRGLDRDIERLGTWLKIINIGLVPLLLIAFVLIVVWRRSRESGT
ncbi:MAG: Gldg family protein [Woeseiaceae bacterium]